MKLFSPLLKSILICSLCVIGGVTIFAQPKTTGSTTSSDPEAEKYLKSIKTKLMSIKGYKLSFTFEVTDADQKKEVQKGSYLGSGDKYELELSDVKTINDGKTQWSVNKLEKEIHISNYTKSKKSKMETPMDIIKNYSNLFKYRVKEPEKNHQVVLELIPLSKNSNFFKVDLILEVKKNTIVAAKLYDRGGHRIQFQFADMQELRALPLGSFALNVSNYKNYEIIDMR